MTPKTCICCGKAFMPAPQATNQTYCASPNCQKKRKRKWQQDKLRNDPDYRENQALAQKAWASRNKDYWRRYRQSKRELEKIQHTLIQSATPHQSIKSAKMDTSKLLQSFDGGLFTLRVIAHIPDAKMDSWIISIAKFDAASKQKRKM